MRMISFVPVNSRHRRVSTWVHKKKHCTFQDLVHACVPHKLLDGVVLQIAIAAVHLQCLIANLPPTLHEPTPRSKFAAYIEAAICGKQLGHRTVGRRLLCLGIDHRRALSLSCELYSRTKTKRGRTWRTIRRAAVRSVTISASLNCVFCSHNTDPSGGQCFARMGPSPTWKLAKG